MQRADTGSKGVDGDKVLVLSMAGEEASLDKRWVSGLTLHPSVHLCSPHAFFKEMSPLLLLPTQIPQPTDDIFFVITWVGLAQDDLDSGSFCLTS